MKRINRYGVRSLERDFPNNESCLNFIFNTLHKPVCSCGGKYRLLTGYKKYQCSKCRFRISPTAGTIFHKSDTPLSLWFKAILVFSNAKSGISAKELERQLEVTYKCAYRILKQIRSALKQSTDKLEGEVEMDSAYFGGRAYGGKDNKYQKQAMATKTVVMGAVERNGRIRALVVPNATAETHGKFLNENVVTESRLLTDGTNRLDKVAIDYKRESVNHRDKEYVRDDVHVNNIETFWSHVKSSIRGTYKVISKEQFQTYLDAFVFHYNNRYSDKARFEALLGTLLHA